MTNSVMAVIMGIVEGLTEYLPISSTGHLILFGQWIHFDVSPTFDIAIQLGAILAVVVLYRRRFLSYLNFKIFSNKETQLISIAILPALILGFLFHGFIKHHLFSPLTVAWGLLVGGILMLITEHLLKDKSPSTNSLETITRSQALLIGICQCASLWPGVSRSASTIVGGLYGKLDYKTAAEFSFIIAVPVMVIATAYDFLKSYASLTSHDLGLIGIGFVVSFIVALGAIVTFLSLLQRWRLRPFALYRIFLGAFLLWLLY